MSDEHMNDYCTCDIPLIESDSRGAYCGYCGRLLGPPTVNVDKALLVQLAKDLLQCLLEIPAPLSPAEKSIALVRCEQILREHGE